MDALEHLTDMLLKRAGCSLDTITAPDGTVLRAAYALAVPVWELDALWDVLAVLRRALTGEPGYEGLTDLVAQTAADRGEPCTAAGLVAQTERVLAVLLPGIWERRLSMAQPVLRGQGRQ
ncbi:hypothetical protein ACH427_27745 [Streptomyces sp. NPDC020379]|uniref:hypothetical protein n=1 Tax=Streptomyces sp. NPDC020379 TaxID=3365071 RepID=UPI00379F40C4